MERSVKGHNLSGTHEKCRRCKKSCKQWQQVVPVVCGYVDNRK